MIMKASCQYLAFTVGALQNLEAAWLVLNSQETFQSGTSLSG